VLVAILPIRLFGDPVLREKARPVTEFGPDLRRLAEDMIETMHAANGAGLAAPQVGVPLRVFVYDASKGDGHSPMVVCNPEFSERSGTWVWEEGCLSAPGVYVEIERPKDVHVRYQDLDGEYHELDATELEARVFLHETDHLDGVFFFQRADRQARKEAMRRLRETLPPGQTSYVPKPRAGVAADHVL
jgi:peptide deformylase